MLRRVNPNPFQISIRFNFYIQCIPSKPIARFLATQHGNKFINDYYGSPTNTH